MPEKRLVIFRMVPKKAASEGKGKETKATEPTMGDGWRKSAWNPPLPHLLMSAFFSPDPLSSGNPLIVVRDFSKGPKKSFCLLLFLNVDSQS